MPQKVLFRVVHVSGQDENHPAQELNVHSPTSSGWCSSRFCLYPQDIVLYFEQRKRIRKIQILSHQYLIATKIEFFVGDCPDGLGHGLSNARYTRLGYVALSDNEKTGFRARELKSVHVDAVGLYLKMVIHKNFINKHNLYNQVGLVAVNVIGDPIITPLDMVDLAVEDPLSLNNVGILGGRPSEYISPLDDLAFDMYQDPEIASVIRKLERRKQDAVLEERYDFAKRLRDAINYLQKVGEKLGRFEVEKRQAVETEDYERAKLKKIQSDEYRLQVYREVDLPSLLDEPSIDKRFPSVPHRSMVESPPPQPYQREPLSPIPSSARPSASPLPPPAMMHVQITNGDADDRPLPALRRGRTPLPAAAEDEETSGITGEPEGMSERDMREAAQSIDVFGAPLITKAYSKTWSHREDALLDVYRQMNDLPTSSDKEEIKSYFRAAIFLCQRGMKDKVFAVFRAALNLLKLMLTDFTEKHSVPRADVHYATDKVLPPLLLRVGETAQRIRDTSKAYLVDMSQWNTVRPLQVVPHECMRPLKASAHERFSVGRVELCAALYRQHGLTHGVTLDGLMEFCASGLEHRNGEVREAVENLIIELYRQQDRTSIRSHLPADDEKTRKNTMFRKLFETFDEIDGKPSRADAAADKAEKERSKQREIEALQQELADLRNLAAKQQAVQRSPREQPAASKPAAQPPSKKAENKTAVAGAGVKKPTEAEKSQLPVAAAPKKATKEAPVVLEDEVEEDLINLDNVCIFCGERNQAFNEEGLDVHYWKTCPMLKRCASCKQVVEITTLTDHLLHECDNKDNYGQCPRCTEAIPKTELAQHIKEQLCNPSTVPENRCPLCHENLQPGEESWKKHLLGPDGCRQNPRRLIALNRIAESEAASGNSVAKKSNLPRPAGAGGAAKGKK